MSNPPFSHQPQLRRPGTSAFPLISFSPLAASSDIFVRFPPDYHFFFYAIALKYVGCRFFFPPGCSLREMLRVPHHPLCSPRFFRGNGQPTVPEIFSPTFNRSNRYASFRPLPHTSFFLFLLPPLPQIIPIHVFLRGLDSRLTQRGYHKRCFGSISSPLFLSIYPIVPHFHLQVAFGRTTPELEPSGRDADSSFSNSSLERRLRLLFSPSCWQYVISFFPSAHNHTLARRFFLHPASLIRYQLPLPSPAVAIPLLFLLPNTAGDLGGNRAFLFFPVSTPSILLCRLRNACAPFSHSCA